MVDAPPAKTFEYVIPGPRRLKWDKTIKVRFDTNMSFLCCLPGGGEGGGELNHYGTMFLAEFREYLGSIQLFNPQMRALYSNSA